MRYFFPQSRASHQQPPATAADRRTPTTRACPVSGHEEEEEEEDSAVVSVPADGVEEEEAEADEADEEEEEDEAMPAVAAPPSAPSRTTRKKSSLSPVPALCSILLIRMCCRITTAADAASMSAGSDSDEDEDENENGSDSDSDADGDGDGDGARLSAYDALLASLAEVEKPEPQERKRKRRKLEHTATNDDDDKPSTAIEDEGGALDDAYEEDEEEEEQIAPEEANEEEENPADPFESHFSAPSPTFLARASAAKNNTWRSSAQIRPGLGRAVVAVPQGAEEEKERVKEGQWHLKKKLAHNTVPLPPLAQEVFAYRDVLYTQRTVENADDVRRLYVLHALNHVFKTRDRVLKNNAKLGGKGEGDAEVELRDQGFTRPKVLILLPTRNSAAKVVEAIAQCIDVDQQVCECYSHLSRMSLGNSC